MFRILNTWNILKKNQNSNVRNSWNTVSFKIIVKIIIFICDKSFTSIREHVQNKSTTRSMPRRIFPNLWGKYAVAEHPTWVSPYGQLLRVEELSEITPQTSTCNINYRSPFSTHFSKTPPASSREIPSANESVFRLLHKLKIL